eukprot:1261271-Rhodomonas_salina.1
MMMSETELGSAGGLRAHAVRWLVLKRARDTRWPRSHVTRQGRSTCSRRRCWSDTTSTPPSTSSPAAGLCWREEPVQGMRGSSLGNTRECASQSEEQLWT